MVTDTVAEAEPSRFSAYVTQDVAHVFTALDSPARRRAALRYDRNTFHRGGLRTFTTQAQAQAPVLYLHGDDDGGMEAEISARFPSELPQAAATGVSPAPGTSSSSRTQPASNALIAEWINAPSTR